MHCLYAPNNCLELNLCLTLNIFCHSVGLRPFILNTNFVILAMTMKTGAKSCHMHYSDVIMGTMAQITSLTSVYSTIYSSTDQWKHQSFASLAFVQGIHRWPLFSRTKGQKPGKCFHLMTSSCIKRLNRPCNVEKRWRQPLLKHLTKACAPEEDFTGQPNKVFQDTMLSGEKAENKMSRLRSWSLYLDIQSTRGIIKALKCH